MKEILRKIIRENMISVRNRARSLMTLDGKHGTHWAKNPQKNLLKKKNLADNTIQNPRFLWHVIGLF